jgi:collagenase-like PrtC family protease
MSSELIQISIGPIQYHWTKSKIADFYQQAADGPAEIIYLGATVCSKRRELTFEDWLSIGRELRQGGKQVVLSTLGLIESGSELATLRRHCRNGEFPVEANDMGTIQILSEMEIPFIAGPGINLYNSRALEVLVGVGLKRWVLPVELSSDTLSDLINETDPEIESEVIGFGRMTLGWSARCYTARAYDVDKDHCDFRCMQHPDGMLLQTQEDASFLVLNGIQTQSALSLCLADQLVQMGKLGVNVLRICPQSQGTEKVVSIFDRVRQDPTRADACQSELLDMMPIGPCNGYWTGRPGMSQVDLETQGTASE